MNYYYNTHSKINSMNNNAYIDSFFSYICGQLSIQNKIPSFPIFYGNINGIITSGSSSVTIESATVNYGSIVVGNTVNAPSPFVIKPPRCLLS